MNKLTSIPKRLFVFFMIMVLFAASIMLPFGLLQSHSKKTASVKLQMSSVKENIEYINSLHHSLLCSILSGKDESQNAFENTEKEINNSFLQLKDILANLPYSGSRHKKAGVSDALDKFNKSIDDFSSSNSLLLISMKEKGNGFTGIVSRWIKQAKDIDSSIQNSGASNVLNFAKIRTLQADYLLSHNKNILDEMNSLVTDLQSQLPMDDMINSSKLDAFMQMGAEIGALNDRIGFSNHHGDLNNFQLAYELVNESYNNLTISLRKNIHRIHTFTIVSACLSLLLILLGFAFLVYLYFKKSTLKPFEAIRFFVSELSQGRIPGKAISIPSSVDHEGLSGLLNKLASNLHAKADFAHELNQGKFTNDLELLSDADELGIELKKMQHDIISSAEEQAKYNEENAKRRYINEGLAKFANILRLNSNDINRLGDTFIKELVKYLNAIQGGFFILDDSDKEKPILRLSSAFAYNRKKYLEKTILMGEGLVGTCAIEKKTVHLTEIPKEYILITSGLGDAPPDNLMLVPVLHEEEIIGVLEIASLNKFKDFEITFAEEVANNLGSTIITTRVNQRTSELLSRSQQQAVEMAEQEEEMRQNLEELKATQEESGRREEDFRGIVDSLNVSVFMIEYGLNGTITAANDKFLIFLNKTADELVGKPHQSIFGAHSSVDANFWSRLNDLINLTVIEKLTIGKKEFHVKEHFSIIKNKDGLPVKILNILIDIPAKLKS